MIPCNKNAVVSADINETCYASITFCKDKNYIVHSSIVRYSKPSGISERGGFRRNRRTKDRKKQRRNEVENVLKEYNCYKNPSISTQNNVWILMGEAHTRKLEIEEFTCVMKKHNKNRGHFNAPSEEAPRPYGETASELFLKGEKVTNHNLKTKKTIKGKDEQEFVVERDIVSTIEEIKEICFKQAEFGLFTKKQAELIAEDLCQIIGFKRNSTWDPSRLGKCPYEKGFVLPSYHPLVFKFNLWLSVNNLRSNGRFLTYKEREEAFLYVYSSSQKLTAKKLEEYLGIPLNDIKFPFNWSKFNVIDLLGKKISTKLWPVFIFASTSTDIEEFCVSNKLDPKIIVPMWEQRPSGKSAYCEKTIRNLMPFVKQGCTEEQARMAYAEVLEKNNNPDLATRYRQRKPFRLSSKIRNKLRQQTLEQFSLKFINQKEIEKSLGNSIVQKSLKAVLVTFEDIVNELGYWPGNIVLELCREASQGEKVRKNTMLKQHKNEKINQDIAKVATTKKSKIRLKLYRDQKGKVADIIDGKLVLVNYDESKVLSGEGLEIHHCIPRRLLYVNRFPNTLLTTKRLNQHIGQKVMIDVFTKKSIEELIKNINKNKDRKFYLLFDEKNKEQMNELKKRCGLESVSWAASVIRELLEEISIALTGHKVNVTVGKGEYTKILRNEFDIRNKNREVIFHHIEDCIINIEFRSDLEKRLHKAKINNSKLEPSIFKGSREEFRDLVEMESLNTNIKYLPNEFAISGKIHECKIQPKEKRKPDHFVVKGKDGADRVYVSGNNRFVDVLEKDGKYKFVIVPNWKIAKRYQSESQEFRNKLMLFDVDSPFEELEGWKFSRRLFQGSIIEVDYNGIIVPYYVYKMDGKQIHIRSLWIADSIDRKDKNDCTFRDFEDTLGNMDGFQEIVNEKIQLENPKKEKKKCLFRDLEKQIGHMNGFQEIKDDKINFPPAWTFRDFEDMLGNLKNFEKISNEKVCFPLSALKYGKLCAKVS